MAHHRMPDAVKNMPYATKQGTSANTSGGHRRMAHGRAGGRRSAAAREDRYAAPTSTSSALRSLTSRLGGMPKARLYSRLNCETLS